MYLHYPLSHQDVADLLGERGVDVDRSTAFRWVQEFGPELAKRAERHLPRSSQNWHVDETYVRVRGKWRYLWRAIDENGQLVDFRLTARREGVGKLGGQPNSLMLQCQFMEQKQRVSPSPLSGYLSN